MNIFIDFIKSHKRMVVYFLSTIVAMVLAFGTNSVLTKLLEPSVFGLYKYATNFLLVVPTIFEFGIHFSVSRIIASKNTDLSDGIVFTGSIIVSLIGLMVSFGLYGVIFLSDLFEINLGSLADISIIYPFIFVFMLRILVLQVYQGAGKTNILAFINVFQYIVLLLGVFLVYFLSELTFSAIIIIFCCSWFVVMVPYLLSLKNDFKNFKKNLKVIYNETLKNGIYVYFGSIVTSSSSSVIALISGSLYGYEEYGFYSLALSFSQAFTVISSVMTVVKFKENVNQVKIPKNDLKIMISLNIIVYLSLLVFVKPIFGILFTSDYYPAIKYLLVLGIVYSVNGISVYFNRFFVARGFGKITTRNSVIYAIVNIIMTIILIPKFQIMGVVFATLIANIISLISYIFAYSNYLKEYKSIK